MGLKILLVDDEEAFRELLEIILLKKNYEVDAASSGEEALKKLKTNTYDVVLTDMIMEGIDGLAILKFIQSNLTGVDTIIITAYGSVENAVEAMRMGAFSYFIKSNSPQELLFDIAKIQKIKNLSAENKVLKTEINKTEYLLESSNTEFQRILKYAEKVGKTDVNVLILGESGVGKEALARYIHYCSSRRDEVIMPINCYSFAESLLESELYGHEKGAFTGSNEMRIGRFEAADKGTLFLDEIGDIPLTTQTKILRNIENKQIERIGSNKVLDVDFRLISATNKDLDQAVREKKFREDFFYRISTVIIRVPPLRDRKEDLPMFIEYFLKKAQDNLKKTVVGIDQSVMEILLSYNYPGNIRELKNILERLVVLAEDHLISIEDMKHYNVFNKFEGPSTKKTLKEVRFSAEKAYILQVLSETSSNIDATAHILNISSRQLYNKIKDYSIII